MSGNLYRNVSNLYICVCVYICMYICTYKHIYTWEIVDGDELMRDALWVETESYERKSI